jgi:predicted small lipoprotein YifL
MRKPAGLLFIVLALSACGKKGPLIYPDMLLPAAPAGVSARQSGNSVKLSFVLPSKDLAGRNITGLSGTTILKRDEPSSQQPSCSSCTSDFSPFRRLNLDLLPPEIGRYGSLLVLLDGDVKAGRAYTYRISALTNDNQDGAASVAGPVDVVPPPLPPVLKVVSQPTEIQLEFAGLPSATGLIAGYDVYRTLKGEPFPLMPLNREPLTGNRFADTGLERGTSYNYGVRMIVRQPSGGRVESGLSNQVEGRLKDDE